MNILIRKSIPNAITLSNLFLGFVSIVLLSMSLNISGSKFIDFACYLILISSVLDSFDGKIARKLNISSDFGKEIDSLADLISFCLAPAILLFVYYYNLAFVDGQYISALPITLLIVFCSFPVVFGAIRLAKYNALKEMRESSLYLGLPTPANAIFICSIVLFSNRFLYREFFVSVDHMFFKMMYIPLKFLLTNEFIIIAIAISSSILLMSKVNYEKFPLISFKINRKNSLDLLKLILFLFILFSSIVFGYYDIVLLFFMIIYIYGNLLKHFLKKIIKGN